MKGRARGDDGDEGCRYRPFLPSAVYNRDEGDVAGHVDAIGISDAHAGLAPAPPSTLRLKRGWAWVVVGILVGLMPGVSRAHPAAKRLHDDLLSDYNRLIRPVGNHSHKVTVHLGLKLSQLIDIVSIFCYFI